MGRQVSIRRRGLTLLSGVAQRQSRRLLPARSKVRALPSEPWSRSSTVERLPVEEEDAGSNPVGAATVVWSEW